ncbi:sulfatase [Cerasicoccus fimbriatus]|uniref:sulfatase n=1 Tax=Cerasicoccus fimbriatus TaxID=3014554 RepID=UPI0022B36100|nr:sulfatase [Cerasicoccus sp. TK19100]
MKFSLSIPRLALACAALFIGLSAQAAERPNVLFLSVDDLKPSIGAYGDSLAITPNIDRLANSGTIMLNNYCQQAICAPSRMSMFTGLRPDSTKVWDLRTQIQDSNPDAVTMQQLFKENGYTTAGSGKVMHGARGEHPESWSVPFTSKKDLPYADGFPVPAHDNAFYQGDHEQEVYNEMIDKGINNWRERASYMAEHNAMPSTEGLDIPDDAYADGALANWAIDQLEQYAQTKEPFFLTVGFMKPHLPFVAPKKYWDMYDRDSLPLAEFREHAENTPDWVYHKYGELRSYSDVTRDWNKSIEDDQARELINGYYACVSYIDAQIGRVLDSLDKLGLADNTIVVLWGDHGWHLGDHDMWCKHSNFEQATRSPLIIHAPGYQPGRAEGMTEFVDIFPTLVELANLEEPYELEGASLVPLLENENAKVKDYAISQYNRQRDIMGYALRDERYRYVMWMRNDWRTTMPFDPSLVEFIELYDYEKDPLETVNQANNPAYADAAAKLKSQMLEYFKAYEQPVEATPAYDGETVKLGQGDVMIDLAAVDIAGLNTRFASVTRDGDDLILDFELSKKWPSVDFYGPGNTPWNLSAYNAIDITMTNEGSEQIRAHAFVTNPGDTSAQRKRAGANEYLPAGATKTLHIPFANPEYPFTPDVINSLRIFIDKQQSAPSKLRIDSIKGVKIPGAAPNPTAPQASTQPANKGFETGSTGKGQIIYIPKAGHTAPPQGQPGKANTAAPAGATATPASGESLLEVGQLTNTDVELRFASVNASPDGESLYLDFELSSRWPSVQFFPHGETSLWNLTGKTAVDVSLTNESSETVKTFAFIANPGHSQQNKRASSAKSPIAPGETATLSIPIDPTIPNFDPSQVEEVRVFIGMHKAPVRLKLNSITLR